MNRYLDALVDPHASGGGNAHRSTGNDDRADHAVASAGTPNNRPGGGASEFGGLFDDLGHSPFHDQDDDSYSPSNHHQDRLVAERVRVVDPGTLSVLLPPMAHPVPEATEEEQLLYEATDVDEEPPTIEVDLVSALHSYCVNPNEAYGHLVAAALASRSTQRPVTGAEIAEARHNPFLVRMIVASGCLDCDDPVAQRNVQETLDRLMPKGHGEFSPTLYEYLEAFFSMPFVRLSHERYVMLKSSGFENIVLMHKNKHVLPEERIHSVIFNYGHTMLLVNAVFAVVSLLVTTTCTVAIAVVLASWMMIDEPGYQSYGFYTLIAYGCGYALHLIFMVYFMRIKEDERLYEDTEGMCLPSPYVNVCPVLPIFEVICVIRLFRSWPRKRLAFTHNVLVSSRLASMCYAVCFGFPQYVLQSYFSYTSHVVAPRYKRQWSFYFLMVAALAQWGIALFRFSYMMLAYDSTSGLGFACFSIRRIRHSIERHSGVPKILFYLFIFLLEVSAYIVVAASVELGNMDECIFLPTSVISVSGVLMLIILLVFLYIAMLFRRNTLTRLSFVAIPVCALVVATLVLGEVPSSPACVSFFVVVFHRSFVFGYIVYAAFFIAFFSWMVLIFFALLLRTCNIKLFPRFTGPLVRSGTKKTVDSSEEEDSTESERRPEE